MWRLACAALWVLGCSTQVEDIPPRRPDAAAAATPAWADALTALDAPSVPPVDAAHDVAPGDPAIDSIEPPSVGVGSPDTLFEIAGHGFDAGAVGLFDDTALVTDVVSARLVRVHVPAALLASGGAHAVRIRTPRGTTMPVGLTVTYPAPRLTAAVWVIDGDGYLLRVTVPGFAPYSRLLWNDQPRPAAISTNPEVRTWRFAASELHGSGCRIRVENPQPGGGSVERLCPMLVSQITLDLGDVGRIFPQPGAERLLVHRPTQHAMTEIDSRSGIILRTLPLDTTGPYTRIEQASASDGTAVYYADTHGPVHRRDLPDWTAGADVGMGRSVWGLGVAPGRNDRIATGAPVGATPATEVAIYDGASSRVVTAGCDRCWIPAFLDADTLLLLPDSDDGYQLLDLSASPPRVIHDGVAPGYLAGVAWADRRLYVLARDEAYVLDPSTGVISTRYAGQRLVLPDLRAHRVYMLDDSAGPDETVFLTFDLEQGTRLDRQSFPSGFADSSRAFGLVRHGEDGLAYMTRGEALVLLRAPWW